MPFVYICLFVGRSQEPFYHKTVRFSRVFHTMKNRHRFHILKKSKSVTSHSSLLLCLSSIYMFVCRTPTDKRVRKPRPLPLTSSTGQRPSRRYHRICYPDSSFSKFFYPPSFKEIGFSTDWKCECVYPFYIIRSCYEAVFRRRSRDSFP